MQQTVSPLTRHEAHAVRFWGQMNGVIYSNYKAAMREFRPTRDYIERVQRVICVH